MLTSAMNTAKYTGNATPSKMGSFLYPKTLMNAAKNVSTIVIKVPIQPRTRYGQLTSRRT